MDDQRRITRRHVVETGLGTLWLLRAAKALGVHPDTAACRLLAEQEEGPYYVEGEMLRESIAEGKPGIPLTLRLLVVHHQTCQPLANAAVDIWHCDALGLYSGYTKQVPMGPPPGRGGPPPPAFDPQHPGNRPGPPEGSMPAPPPGGNHPTDKLTFLRGIRLTDASGAVTFRTIVPGFYPGRTNHIHFKVRFGGDAKDGHYKAGHTSHSGQVFFPEDLAGRLMTHAPYRNHQIERTTITQDGVFNDQHGELSIAQVVPLQAGNDAAGFRAELIAAVDPEAAPAPVGRRGGPPRG